MIQSENAPTLCVSCVHFTKGIDVGCRVGNYGLPSTPEAEAVRAWRRMLTSETSWTYQGMCPSYQHDGITEQPPELRRHKPGRGYCACGRRLPCADR